MGNLYCGFITTDDSLTVWPSCLVTSGRLSDEIEFKTAVHLWSPMCFFLIFQDFTVYTESLTLNVFLVKTFSQTLFIHFKTLLHLNFLTHYMNNNYLWAFVQIRLSWSILRFNHEKRYQEESECNVLFLT